MAGERGDGPGHGGDPSVAHAVSRRDPNRVVARYDPEAAPWTIPAAPRDRPRERPFGLRPPTGA